MRVVPKAGGPGKLAMEVPRLAVSRHVHEVVVIHVDSMLARGPDTPVLLPALLHKEAWIARPAPRLKQIPGLIELEDSRRRRTAASQPPVRPGKSKRANRITLSVLARFPLHAAVGRSERARTVIHPDVVRDRRRFPRRRRLST